MFLRSLALPHSVVKSDYVIVFGNGAQFIMFNSKLSTFVSLV